ncbi:MAG: hypothetical protein ACXVB4_17280, partial [Pseudobdellovibrionaceae bacterium]
MKILSRLKMLSFVILASLILFFQNCGPAKLSGYQIENSQSIYTYTTYQVGMKVDLHSLLSAAQENSNNVLFPLQEGMNNYYYCSNCPIIENLVLNKNDFTSILWVHGPSSTVMSMGDSFNQKNFSLGLEGVYYIFGFRAETPYLITQFQLNSSSSTLGVNSSGAIQITQTIVNSDSVNEWALIT